MIALDDQIAEVKRELGMRRHVYPRFVDQKRMTPQQAAQRIALLEAVQDSLERLRDEQRPSLFDAA